MNPLYYDQADFNALAEQLLLLAMKGTDENRRLVNITLSPLHSEDKRNEVGRRLVDALELVTGSPIFVRPADK